MKFAIHITLLSYKCMLVFSCFRDTPNSKSDIWTTGVFNVRTRSFLCVTAYTHGRLAHRQRVSTICLTREKERIVTNFYRDPGGVRTSGQWILSPTPYQLTPPPTHTHTHPLRISCARDYTVISELFMPGVVARISSRCQ